MTPTAILKLFIKEELDRNMRWSAGIAPQGIAGGRARTTDPLPSLGDPIEHEEEQKTETKNRKR